MSYLVLWIIGGIILVLYRLYNDYGMLRELGWKPGKDEVSMSCLEAAIFWPVNALIFIVYLTITAFKGNP